MAKSFPFAAVIASALCLSSLLSIAFAAGGLNVEGKVYCDTCGVEFQTKISKSIPGTKVKLECRVRENSAVTYSVEGVTDETGTYKLPVVGDHENEICEITLISSGDPQCSEKFNTTNSARVLLTHNVGLVQPTRYTNPLGFKTKNPSTDCKNVLQQLGFLPL